MLSIVPYVKKKKKKKNESFNITLSNWYLWFCSKQKKYYLNDNFNRNYVIGYNVFNLDEFSKF